MNISDVDLKLLWGKAAGRCSFPGCINNCIEFLEKTGDIILGEMAHVIAQSSKGPRGNSAKAGPFVDFREHALALERNSYERMDREIVPRFPSSFQKMLISYAK
jgi:hypothetical protein